MFAFVKDRLVVKIALTMAIPLLVNLVLYGEMQRQVLSLERLTQELSVRRQIADRANQIIISNFFALQSLMQYKFFSRDTDKEKFLEHIGQFTSEIQTLSDTLKGRPGEETYGYKLEAQGHEYLKALSGSEFSPDVHNQVGSFFDNLEKNQRLKKASVKFMLTLKEVGKKVQEDVERTNLEEMKSRADLRQFCQFTMFANSIVALAVAFLVGTVMVRKINVVRANSERLAAGEPLLAPVSSGDEIGKLDATFREMAQALEFAREKEKTMAALVAESRDELALVIDNVPAALFITDGKGKIESLNTVASTLFSIDLLYFRDGGLEKLFQLKKNEKNQFFQRMVAEANLKPVQLLAVDSNGESVPVSLSLTPFVIDGITRYLATVVDETERLMLEQAKSDFFSMVSHDMRTPLTSISGVLQIAIEGAYGELPEKAKERLQLARTNSSVLLEMMNKLLKIEKMENSNLDLQLEAVDLAELAEEARALVSPQLDPKSLQLELKTVPCLVEGDKSYLLEVILNLLTNSIKYSPPEGKLEINCVCGSGESRFELRDQGPGIPDEKKAEIFNRFAQADKKRDRNKGFGLGLAICHKIVTQHGGAIGVSDAAGGGSVFWFSLPALSELNAQKDLSQASSR